MSDGPVEGSRDLNEIIYLAEQDYLLIRQVDCTTVPGNVCYHCQQIVEKYMKALLLVRGELPPRTHDLVELKSRLDVGWAEEVATDKELEELTVFEVVGRYWGDWPRPAPSDAKMAVDVMKRVRSFIRAELELDSTEDGTAEADGEPEP